MKKLFAILAVASVMTACNNSSETPADTKDSVSMAAEAQRVADSVAAAAKGADTAVKAVVDSAAKAVVDTAKAALKH